MEEWLASLTHYSILLIDLIALLVILVGTVEAFFYAALYAFPHHSTNGRRRREVWLRYARWLVAGLTFQLAADIIETSVAPDWDDIGRLAAIAVIRTFLNFFLERDLEDVRDRMPESASVGRESRWPP